jgi:hypothetical protein
MYTILQQQKCGSSTCTNNETLLNDHNIYLTSHFSSISSINLQFYKQVQTSLPYCVHYNDLVINKETKSIALIRDPFKLLSSHFHQMNMGCMDVRYHSATFKDFIHNIEEKRYLHPLHISTHYPLYDDNFKLIKIDYLLHLNDLDTFLSSQNVPKLKREKVTHNKVKSKFDNEMKKIVERYYQHEIQLSKNILGKGLVEVVNLDKKFYTLPSNRILELHAIDKKF